MPLRFGPYRRDDEDEAERSAPRTRRRPPDYTSRSVRFRLWILVGMVMLVLTLMVEARKPQNYAWLWKLGGPEQAAPKPASPKANPKEGARAKPAISIQAGQVPGTIGQSNQAPSAASAEDELLARTRKDGWLRAFEQLPSDQRERLHDLLFALLRHARANTEASEEERKRGEVLLTLLDQAWTSYQADALSSLANASDDDKKGWLEILNTLQREWSSETRPALQTLVEGKLPDDDQRAALNKLQGLLDRLAIEAIQDNTVFNRSAERFAWFRLFEVLGGADEEELQQVSLGTVGYVQLLKQPKDYRAKLVTIKGKVELGYRLPAFENVEGIKQYYIFWMRPAEGLDSPYVIYALETPPGFPPVLPKDEHHQETNRLNVEAEFTGYFFKRVAYLSHDNTRTTPLLLARTPHIDRSLAAALAPIQGAPPTPPTFGLVLGCAAGLGLAIAAIAFFGTRRRKPSSGFPAEVSADDLRRLEELAAETKSKDNESASPLGGL